MRGRDMPNEEDATEPFFLEVRLDTTRHAAGNCPCEVVMPAAKETAGITFEYQVDVDCGLCGTKWIVGGNSEYDIPTCKAEEQKGGENDG